MFDTIVKTELAGGQDCYSQQKLSDPGTLGSIPSTKKGKEDRKKRKKKVSTDSEISYLIGLILLPNKIFEQDNSGDSIHQIRGS